MSTGTNATDVVNQAMRDGAALLEAARGGDRVAQQIDFLDPITPEEMVEARASLELEEGQMSGRDVLAEARKQRAGRPKGARNRRTDDFARYLLQFGQHPAITMMQIQATPPEVLVEASAQRKVHSFRKDGTPNIVVEKMSYETAQSLRIRCAEGLMPYLESKMPVKVELDANGDFNLLVPGMNISAGDARKAAEGTFMLDGEYLEVTEDPADGK